MQSGKQRARAGHVTSWRIVSIDHLPRSSIQRFPACPMFPRRTKHDNQSKAPTFGLGHGVDDVEHTIAAARKSVERCNARVATKLSQSYLCLRTVRASGARYIQHPSRIASAASIFEGGRLV